MNKPKILSIDFESSPAKGYFFGSIWETNIIQVIEYEQILCVAYKWNDEPVKVIGQDDFKTYKAGVLDDKELIKFFAPIIEKADIVSAHNGDRFDITLFNTRLLAHGMKPVPISKTYDTKKMAKAVFHLPSNKLDDIADFLGIGRKLSTHKSLWFGCESGDKNSWHYMKKYCKNDVALQYDVLVRILPFTKQTGNFVFVNDSGVTCPSPLCLSKHMTKDHRSRVKGGWKQQYQCQDCGSYYTDPKIIKDEK